jgi:molecular chaperone DnaK
VTFDDPVQGMREVGFATRDTPEALRRAVAESALRQSPGVQEPEVRRGGGLFGWLRRS